MVPVLLVVSAVAAPEIVPQKLIRPEPVVIAVALLVKLAVVGDVDLPMMNFPVPVLYTAPFSVTPARLL